MKSWTRWGAWLCALVFAGCGGDDTSTPTDAATGSDAAKDVATSDAGSDAAPVDSGADAVTSDGGSVAPGTIEGVVTKGPSLTFSGDGKGTLWVDIGTSCPYQGNIQVTKTITVPSSDLTPTNAKIPFTMTGVAPGTYHVWGWLDDNGDGQPFPNGGDPGNNPTCPQVTLTANAGASVTLVFNSSTWN